MFFVHFCREKVFGPKVDTVVAQQVAAYIRDMFTPHNWVKGETMSSRTAAAITRDCWMDFLGAECQRVFNPVLPHESGPHTLHIRKNLATAIRAIFFGMTIDVRFLDKDHRGNSTIETIVLPLPKGQFSFYFLNCYMIYVLAIDRDLARKFKNRRQSEYKFLDQLFDKCHSSDSSPSVTESPRKPFCAKNTTLSDNLKGREWQEQQLLGRKRKTREQFMATTAVSLKSSFLQSQAGGLDVNVQVTLSPTKLNKRQRIAREHPNTTSGLFDYV